MGTHSTHNCFNFKLMDTLMEQECYLIQKSSKGKVKFLKYTLSGNRLTKEWGRLNGSVQGVLHDYKPINAGKANELSAMEAAAADYLRLIQKKKQEGYTQANEDDFRLPYNTAGNGCSMDNVVQFEHMDFHRLPTELCCSKPTQTVSNSIIDKLIKSGNAKFFVKYNGLCHYIAIDDAGKVLIYTRRWLNHTSKYPAIVEAVKQLNLPNRTMMIVELCIDPSKKIPHTVAFQIVSEISKKDTLKGVCKPDQSASIQKQTLHQVRLAVFGYIFYKGEFIAHNSYKDQWEYLSTTIPPISENEVLFRPQTATFTSGANAVELALKHSSLIEGFVLWDDRLSMEMSFTGKPLRRACWKIKPVHEMDVIAYAGVEGKSPGKFGSISIGRYNDQGELTPMGTVGGIKQKEAVPSYWKFPCVIEVTYSNVFPATGHLQFGSFSKIHEDKALGDVELFTLDQKEIHVPL